MVQVFVGQVFLSILMLVSVAFYILTERKGLGMLQLRKGPNKPSFKAIFQPIADGVKLFTKEVIVPHTAISKEAFFMGPFMCFFCAYSLWILYPSSSGFVWYEMGVFFFLCISSVSVYGVFLVGWVCDSRYGFLGSMRAVAQTVSYEVFLSTTLFCPLVLVESFDLMMLRDFSFLNFLVGLEVMVMWVIASLAETNRTPFDFVEGESELVAGYMVEFGGVTFALLALAEYSNMMFMSMLTSLMFFGWFVGLSFWGDLMFGFITIGFAYFFIWVRATMPRYRYDLLMKFCWEQLLPLSLAMLGLYISFLSG